MEIEGDDGSKTELHFASQSIFGRGSGFTTDDVTVSRRHLLLRLEGGNQGQPPRVSFEVIGTNPAWVRTGGEVKTFKKSEKGELRPDDCFCISSRPPVWFRLKTVVPQSEAEVENVDASPIDPVKEFGFVVIGREFEGYPKGRVRDAKEWDWFLEDAAGGIGEDEDEEGSGHGGGRRKKKRKGRRDEEEDEDWSDEREIEVNARRKSKDGGGTYATRSKQVTREKKGKKKIGEEDEDEDDETLGGFIVDEEELEEEEEEEEEDELMDDEHEDDDDV